MARPPMTERAFERSGRCIGMADIRRTLQTEGYAANGLYGGSLARQLRTLCIQARDRYAKITPVTTAA